MECEGEDGNVYFMFSLLNKKRPVKEQYFLVQGMVWRKKNMNLEEKNGQKMLIFEVETDLQFISQIKRVPKTPKQKTTR